MTAPDPWLEFARLIRSVTRGADFVGLDALCNLLVKRETRVRAETEAVTRLRIAAFMRTVDQESVMRLIAASFAEGEAATNGQLVERVVLHLADLVEEAAVDRHALEAAHAAAVLVALDEIEATICGVRQAFTIDEEVPDGR